MSASAAKLDLRVPRVWRAPPDSTQGRVATLDGLRGIAILLVLVTHYWPYPTGYELINRFARTGWAGVDLFFVLSGYLITGILWDARASARYYLNFYARRVLRIFPLYYALLFMVFVLLPLHDGAALSGVLGDRPLYLGYLANVALVLHGWQLFPLDITWSLAVEEQFYLVWPFVVRRLPVRGLLIALACAVIVVPVARTVVLLGFNVGWMTTHMLTVFRLDSLALGGLIALGVRHRLLGQVTLRHVAAAIAVVVGLVLAVLIATNNFRRSSMFVGTIGYSLLAVFFGALLVCALFPGRALGRTLAHPALRRIGVVSYGIYILHPLCLMVGATALSKIGVKIETLTPWPIANSLTTLALFSAFAYVAAELSFRFFERPILGLQARFRSAPARPAPSAVAA